MLNIMLIKVIIIIFVLVCLVSLYIIHYNNKKLTSRLQDNPKKEIYTLNNFFSATVFSKIQRVINQYYNQYNVRNDNYLRKGSSFSHHQMSDTPLSYINNLFDNVELLNNIKKRTGLNLQFVPKTDPNRLGVLIYQKPQDGIDWHYDGNNYYGNRWVGIFTVKNRNTVTGRPSSSKFSYILDGKEYTRDSRENSLLLFRGDKIKHKVSPLGKDEIRIVVSLLFCDICERKINPIDHIYQLMVNLNFYGKV